MNTQRVSWLLTIVFLLVTSTCAYSPRNRERSVNPRALGLELNRLLDRGRELSLITTTVISGPGVDFEGPVLFCVPWGLQQPVTGSEGIASTAILVQGNFGSCTCAISNEIMGRFLRWNHLDYIDRGDVYGHLFTQRCLGRLETQLDTFKQRQGIQPKIFAIEYNGRRVTKRPGQLPTLQAELAVTYMTDDLLAMIQSKGYEYRLGKVYSISRLSICPPSQSMVTVVSQGPVTGEEWSQVEIYSQGTGQQGKDYGVSPAITLTLMKPRPYSLEPGEPCPIADPLIFEDAEVVFNEDLVVLAPSEES